MVKRRSGEAAAGLRGRWEFLVIVKIQWQAGAVRPEAHALAKLPPFWPNLFEGFDGHAGSTGVPIEVRFPFLDLRLVNFMLALTQVAVVLR